MDAAEKQKDYETKKTEIAQHFKKQKGKKWLIWGLYNLVADLVIFLAGPKLYLALMHAEGTAFIVTVFLVSTLLSLYLTFKEITTLNRQCSQQLLLLQDDAPFSRFRTRDE